MSKVITFLNHLPHFYWFILGKTNYIVIDSFDMPVDFYEFVKNEYGVNKKRIINSIPIRIAVKMNKYIER